MIKKLSLASLLILVIVSLLSTESVSSASILDTLGDKISNTCLTNSQCNKEFFAFNNYCCNLQCCNWFSYVFDTEPKNWWDRFVTTVKEPRAFSIILAVLSILVLLALISAIISLLSYFLCGCCRCCGSKGYVLANH